MIINVDDTVFVCAMLLLTRNTNVQMSSYHSIAKHHVHSTLQIKHFQRAQMKFSNDFTRIRNMTHDLVVLQKFFFVQNTRMKLFSSGGLCIIFQK